MFRLENFMGKRILTSSFLDGEAVRAFFTTRDLPLKAGERDDLIEEVENNKKLLCDGFNIPLSNLIIPIQTHSDNIKIVNGKRETVNGNEQNLSPLTSHFSPFENTDALVTNEKNVALALNFADCVPIIFFDPIKKVTAIAHAGWRGTVAKIAPKTVEKMIQNFSSKPNDIIALIGPAIGKCCFEVQDEVKTKLLDTVEESYHAQICDGNNLDLKLINKFQLLADGVEKIDLCEYCTFCQSELFFSYRRENGKTARHSAVVMARGQ